MSMKVIAMYLPQFHRIEENDKWWGIGYTEWTAVKNAIPLFDDHDQPVVPMDGYYNLTDVKTMERQADLMRRYQVDGMCFYHYWFAKGKKVLEKPAELLLNSDIDMPFCFCWANETWARTWKIENNSANAWASKYEDNESPDDNGILIQQKYGELLNG